MKKTLIFLPAGVYSPLRPPRDGRDLHPAKNEKYGKTSKEFSLL